MFIIESQVLAQPHSELQFIQSRNQWNEELDFLAKVPGGQVSLSAGHFSVYLIDQEKLDRDHLKGHQNINESDGLPAEEPTRGHLFQINLLGANTDAKPIPSRALPGYYNYFLGSDTCRWAANVPAFAEIVYPEIYFGIDLRISSLGQNLKYDFLVKPGADPNQIQIEYCGVDGIEIKDGDAIIQTSLGYLTEKKPLVYQQVDGKMTTVPSAYSLTGDNLSFFFPDGYDRCYDLVIDPLLIFSTYSGSTADNWGSTATPGEHGTVYSSGITRYFENDPGIFPATPGAFQTTYGGLYDIAIIKYDSAGTKFLYATFLGGSGNETPQSLVVDKLTGDLIVLGVTSSTNYPVTQNAWDKTFNFGQVILDRVLFTTSAWDLAVTRISQSGDELIGSTYLGGSNNDGLNYPQALGGPLDRNYGDEFRGDIITDVLGNIYLSSVTSSSDFPVTPGFDNTYGGGTTDGVVVKLNPDLSSILWSGFLGGAFYDASYSVKLDASQNVIAAGGTTSGNFPITSGSYQTILGGNADGWIVRIAADGSTILNSTFTGTISYDQVYFVDLNESGEIFCYGQTSGAMPVTPGVYSNPNSGQFLQKFNADLSTLIFSTVFGSGIGIPNISPTAFLVNECDNIFMSGWGGVINSDPRSGYWQSSTTGMPVTSDAFQKTTKGSDFYFIVLNSNASELVYATFLGGNDSKTHVDGGTSRFDKFGVVYHAVCSGCQYGNEAGQATSDFPTTPGAWSRLNKSTNCNNAAFKFDLASLRARFQTNSVNFDSPNLDRACFPDSILFENLSTGGEFYVWDFDDGTVITKPKSDIAPLVHQFQQEGVYHVKLKAIDDNTCSVVDSITRTVKYFREVIEVPGDTDLCQGSSYELTATGGSVYAWTSNDGSFTSSQSSPVVQPEASITYYVTITDSDGCSIQDTVDVNVIPEIDLNWKFDFITDCVSRPYLHVSNRTEVNEDDMVFFDFGDGTTSDEQEVDHYYAKDSLYQVKIVGVRGFCAFEKSANLPFYTLFVPNVFTPELSPGFNDTFEIGFGNKGGTPAQAGVKIALTVFDRWGKKVFESNDYKNDWDASNVGGGVYYLELKLGNLATCKNWVQVVK